MRLNVILLRCFKVNNIFFGFILCQKNNIICRKENILSFRVLIGKIKYLYLMNQNLELLISNNLVSIHSFHGVTVRVGHLAYLKITATTSCPKSYFSSYYFQRMQFDLCHLFYFISLTLSPFLSMKTRPSDSFSIYLIHLYLVLVYQLLFYYVRVQHNLKGFDKLPCTHMSKPLDSRSH